LATKSINRLDTVRALDILGIPSYATTDSHSVAEIISSTQKLADVLGAPERASPLVTSFGAASLRCKRNSPPFRRGVFSSSFGPNRSFPPASISFIADVLRKAGAASIVESSQDWPADELEEVVRLQPDYLWSSAPRTASCARRFRRSRRSFPDGGILDAVRNRRYAVISDASIALLRVSFPPLKNSPRHCIREGFPGFAKSGQRTAAGERGVIRSRPAHFSFTHTICSSSL